MILVVALVFLVLLALVALAAVESGGLQLRMASNHWSYQRALRLADDLAVAMLHEGYRFDPGVTVGTVRCLEGNTNPGCDHADLALPVTPAVPTGVSVDMALTRRDPERLLHPSTGTTYLPVEITVTVDGRSGGSGLGRASVALGFAQPEQAGEPWLIYWREPGIDAR